VKSSLRTRLLIGVVGAVLLLLTIFSVGIYSVIRSALLRQFDASLVSIAQILAASVEWDGDQIELEFEVQQMPEFQDRNRPTYYQLWRDDGTVVAQSPLLDSGDLPHLAGSLDKPAFRTIRPSAGRVVRAVGFGFSPRLSDSDSKLTGRQSLTLSVVRDSTAILSQLRFLRWVLLLASVAVALLSVAVAALIVRQGLRPLTAIAGEIGAIRENDLATRIGTERVPSELLPVKNRLNDLLSRLEAAFKRERRFTADVAHELRTPLAGIRSTIEVAQSRARDQNEYKRVLADCHAIVENMQTMVSDLLTLARLDTQQTSMHTEQIPMAEFVNMCWQPFSHRAREREITFDNRIDPKITAESDRHSLFIVLSNLLENAAEYADDGGQIWTTAHRQDDSIELTISNTGCRLTPEQASQALDSFWRGDSSRTDTGAHCGLGLALVKRIVVALGGFARVDLEKGGIFTAKVTLPGAIMKPHR
jgi:two-component system heavy metal sensor histidine kinase CusS